MQSNFSLLRRFRWRSSILFGKRKFYMCYCIWFDSHAKITHDCELIINILSTHSQAKICGRSNIVKDDIRWNYITLRQMISNFFLGTWLSYLWTPRAVRRCCVRTAPSTCCDPTLCLTLHQSPLSLTWDVRHLYHHHCYQIPVSGDTPMFICILGLDCKEDVPKNSSLTIASL